MKRWMVFLIVIIAVTASSAAADGLLVPSNEFYPGDILRNRVTEVTVTVRGLIAETVVYQEFKNEWENPTDAVWSFPLPPDARATTLKYSYGDVTYAAVLQEKEQGSNPGTGEGGVIAEINKYLGRNVLRLTLLDIPGGEIQKIELHYISLLDYHRGECTYRYPFDTESFIPYPIDHVEFNVDVQTTRSITGYDIPSHSGYEVLTDEDQHIRLRLRQPKVYAASDIVFTYQVDDQALGVDFYSVMNPFFNDGYFNLMIRPGTTAENTDVFPRRIVFLLNNSSGMAGYKLEQSIAAISQSLDQLEATDEFNVVVFNTNVYRWRNSLVTATSANVAAARDYLEDITGGSGSRIDIALLNVLNLFSSADYSNAILLFTDGRSPLNPQQIAAENDFNTGIFPIGIGDDIDRSKLEMLSALNHGFVTYFNEDDNLLEGMVQVFEKVSRPLIKDATLSIDKADVSDLLPASLPTLFAGSYFFVAGKYGSAGPATVTLSGEGVDGPVEYRYQVDFSGSTADRFAERLWVKEQIDAYEREISVYGETLSLKNSATSLSLNHGIRCRYTSYVAEYSEENQVATGIECPEEETGQPVSYVAGNYPNPFNPMTTIRLYIDPDSAGMVKLLKIYNILGQLVAVIDLSHLSSGWKSVRFNALDYQGMALSNGVYFAQLQIGNRPMNVIRMQLMK